MSCVFPALLGVYRSRLVLLLHCWWYIAVVAIVGNLPGTIGLPFQDAQGFAAPRTGLGLSLGRYGYPESDTSKCPVASYHCFLDNDGYALEIERREKTFAWRHFRDMESVVLRCYLIARQNVACLTAKQVCILKDSVCCALLFPERQHPEREIQFRYSHMELLGYNGPLRSDWI